MKISWLLLSVLLCLSAITPLFAENNAYIGVYLEEPSDKALEKLGMDQHYGVQIIAIIADTPAMKAGLEINDLILEFNGDKIYTREQLIKILSTRSPGETVKIKVLRNKKKKTIKLTLGKQEIPQPIKHGYLGIYPENINSEKRNEINLKESHGILLREMVKDGPAAKAGLKDNDIILKINDDKLYTIDQLTKMLKNYEPGQEIKAYIFRNPNYKTINIILGEKEITQSLQFKDFHFNVPKIPENVFIYKYDSKTDNWLGVIVESITTTIDNQTTSQVSIKKIIKHSPADSAGLKTGDIILKVSDQKISEGKDITNTIASKKAGEKIIITIKRNNKTMEIPVRIGDRKDFTAQEKVEVSVDNGEVRILVDGEEKALYNLEETLKDMENLNEIKELEQQNNIDIKVEEKAGAL